MASILEEIEKTISKPPECRTENEISRLFPWFKKKSDVFRSLKPDAVTDIIRNCEMISRPKDTVIIRQHDKGNCFFIILSGKVSVYIATKDDDDEVDDETERAADIDHPLGLPVSQASIDSSNTCENCLVDKIGETAGETITKSLPQLVSGTVDRASSGKPVSLSPVVEAYHLPIIAGSHGADKSKYGQYVATINDGKSFGELALLKKNCIRNATIITDCATQLLVVNRQLYNRCIRESQEKEFVAKQMFVHTSEYFEGWNLRSKRQFAMSLHLRTYEYGTPVVCQGQPFDFIYFLQSGQCRVIIDPAMHKSQYLSYSQQLLNKHPVHRPATETEYLPPQIARRGKKTGYSLRGHDICLIGKLNMIGDIELSTNLSTYMQTVICEQYTEAFAIDLRNYDRLVTRRHAVTGRFIAQNALLKLDNRAHRFTHIPLLQILVERFARLLTDYNRIKRQREKQISKSKMAAQPAHGNRCRTVKIQGKVAEMRKSLPGHLPSVKAGVRAYCA